MLTDFGAAVVTVTMFGSKTPMFVGLFAVETCELLAHSLSQSVSSALVPVLSVNDRVPVSALALQIEGQLHFAFLSPPWVA